MNPESGWYVCPTDLSAQTGRYWDGETWTHHVCDIPPGSTLPRFPGVLASTSSHNPPTESAWGPSPRSAWDPPPVQLPDQQLIGTLPHEPPDLRGLKRAGLFILAAIVFVWAAFESTNNDPDPVTSDTGEQAQWAEWVTSQPGLLAEAEAMAGYLFDLSGSATALGDGYGSLAAVQADARNVSTSASRLAAMSASATVGPDIGTAVDEWEAANRSLAASMDAFASCPTISTCALLVDSATATLTAYTETMNRMTDRIDG